MQILLIVFLNIVFIVVVYLVFSRRVRALEEQRLPAELRKEINSLITGFNQTADRNIDLLDDRVQRATALSGKLEKQIRLLDGLLKRAEAMQQNPESPASSRRYTAAGALPTRQLEPAITPSGAALAYRDQHPAQQGAASGGKKPPRKRRRKQSLDEKLRSMADKGRSPEEMAADLGIPREEVLFKLRLQHKNDGSQTKST